VLQRRHGRKAWETKVQKDPAPGATTSTLIGPAIPLGALDVWARGRESLGLEGHDTLNWPRDASMGGTKSRPRDRVRRAKKKEKNVTRRKKECLKQRRQGGIAHQKGRRCKTISSFAGIWIEKRKIKGASLRRDQAQQNKHLKEGLRNKLAEKKIGSRHAPQPSVDRGIGNVRAREARIT